jgi:peptidoglycan/xylan/chitin deacetylase (PgdA/CDA1 family)
MSLPLFERQVAYLRKHRDVISLNYLYDCIANGWKLDPRQVVLTFDDGYKNNLRIVGPLLSALKLPFAIFVSTRHIEEGQRLSTYWIRVALLYTEKKTVNLRSTNQSFSLTSREGRIAAAGRVVEVAKRAPLHQAEQIRNECIDQLTSGQRAELNNRFASDELMGWDDLGKLVAMGATVGSHCHDHCILHANQSDEEVRRQLTESKAAIEKHFGECEYLAYPNGTLSDISEVAYDAARAVRFRMGLTTISGEVTQNTDCLLMPRIHGATKYEEFCYLLNRSSRYNAAYQAARLRLLPGSESEHLA